MLSDAEGVTFNVQISANWFNALGAACYSTKSCLCWIYLTHLNNLESDLETKCFKVKVKALKSEELFNIEKNNGNRIRHRLKVNLKNVFKVGKEPQ